MGSLTWNGGPGDWSQASDWTIISGTDTVPGAGDDVTVAAPTNYVITVSDAEAADNITITDTGATLKIAGTLSLGGTLADAGHLSLPSGGVLSGGTVALTGTATIASGASLDNVTWDGALSGFPSALIFTSAQSLDLSGVFTSTTNTLDLSGGIVTADAVSGGSLELNISDNETLDGVTLTLPTMSTIAIASGATVTLGPSTVLNSNDYSELSGYPPTPLVSGTLVNQGSMNVGDIDFTSVLTNDGAISIGEDLSPNGEQLQDTVGIINNGLITLGEAVILGNGGSMLAGTLSGDGTLDIEVGSATLTTLGAGQHVTNAGGYGIFLTVGSIDPGATIELVPVALRDILLGSAAITLSSLADDGNINAFFSGTTASGTLTITDGTTTVSSFNMTGVLPDATYTVSSANDGASTEIVIRNVACFATGTRILTRSGETRVETLKVGEHVMSVFGGLVPVIWVGQRHVDCRHHPRPQDVWPVRVRAGAFAEQVPARDLLLSPDHAVYVDGVLIPVRYLINGTTVVQEDAERVTYWHVELDRHNVILAEGLPCESYLDTGNRSAFTNGGGATSLHPDFAMRIWETKACAKLVLDGAELSAARRKFLNRARAMGFAATNDPDLRLKLGDVLIRPRLIAGRLHRFSLPAGAGVVTIASRSGVPAEISAAARDHRQLGVMVERIILRRPGWQQEVSLDTIPISDGFYPLERDGMRTWRWTDGNARLFLPTGVADDGKLLLDLHVAAAQESWVGIDVAASANGSKQKRSSSVGVMQNESFPAVA